FFQQRRAGEAAAITAEKREKCKRAGLAGFQLWCDVRDAQLVRARDANVGESQLPAQCYLVFDFNFVAAQFGGIEILAGLARPVIDGGGRRWSHGTHGNNVSEKVTLLLKLQP